MRHTRPASKNSGFTLVELTVVLFALGIIVTSLIVVLITAYRDGAALNDKVNATNNMSAAFWFMDDNVRLASTFLMTVPSPFTDPYGPHNLGSSGAEAWNRTGDSATSRVLITRNYASSSNPLGTGRGPVFEDSPTLNCTTELHYQPQLPYISIYFLRNNTLYRRVLTDTTTPLCPGYSQYQKQSCPPYLTPPLNAICFAKDEVLANNISEFKVDYYQVTSAGTGLQIDPTYTSTDPTTLDAADYIIVTLTTSIKNGNVTNSMQQRFGKVNI